MKPASVLLLLSIVFGFQSLSYAAPKVGKRAAARYFAGEVNGAAQQQEDEAKIRRTAEGGGGRSDYGSGADHFLTLGFSQYANTEAYKWGQEQKEEKVGEWGIDMMYRTGDFSSLIDEALRVSYNEYEAMNKRASKISLMYALTLPDAGSQFPLYFGAAFGPGIFFKQLQDESPLSFDYQLYLGLRLFNVMEKTGFYVEGGLKNHLQLTSDGQLNGSYVAAGAVFTF